MLFQTIEFFGLFLVVLVVQGWLPNVIRRVVLLAASYVFYAWFSIPLLGLLLFSTGLDFVLGRWMLREADPARRKLLLLGSLVGNLGLLFTFKYANWFLDSLNGLAGLILDAPPFPALELILPLGISFYTFQTLSYSIDIYRGKITKPTDLLTYALYVSFFPQLVAGPIVRARALIPQLERGPSWLDGRFLTGLLLFAHGLFRKVVVADTLAPFVDVVFSAPGAFGTWALLTATYAFAFQIYCDFSGYTNMARGAAFMLGYDVGENFRQPYFAEGFRAFWRRWHISLSTWLRDYLYIALGGNRDGRRRTARNLALTMLLGGLWHGANWTFVAWGALHGAYLIAERYGPLGRPRSSPPPRWLRLLAMVGTFHLVCLGWIFFRCASLTDVGTFLSGLVRVVEDPIALEYGRLLWIALVLGVDAFLESVSPSHRLRRSVALRWLAIATLVILTIAFGQHQNVDFIYFQF